MAHLDGAPRTAPEQRYGFTALCLYADIGANPVELAEVLGLPEREQTYSEAEQFDPAFVEVAHAAGATTFDELADLLSVAHVFTASTGAVTSLMNLLACRRFTDDQDRHWCIEHGSYYDHEPWTRRGCAVACRIADLVTPGTKPDPDLVADPDPELAAEVAEIAGPDFTEIDNGYLYLPDGCPPDHAGAHSMQVVVTYRGTYSDARNGGEPVAWYSVEHGGASLTRAGNWSYAIRPFQRQQHRFSLDEARFWAARVVNDVTVNGRTWAQWQEYFAAGSQG